MRPPGSRAPRPDVSARRFLTGWSTGSALGLHTWSGAGIDGSPDAFIMLDGNYAGGPAGAERDGSALGRSVGRESEYMFTDIETSESWYPILVTEKRARPGVYGGDATARGWQQHGLHPPRHRPARRRHARHAALVAAGGRRGRVSRCLHPVRGPPHRHRGRGRHPLLRRGPQRWRRVRVPLCLGAGFGDPPTAPIDRSRRSTSNGAVPRDEALAISTAWSSTATAWPDPDATASQRRAAGRRRLEQARRPAKPVGDDLTRPDGAGVPLSPGVVQYGNVAVAGAERARPGRCAGRLDGRLPRAGRAPLQPGPTVEIRAYLDPRSGQSLYVEAVPAGSLQMVRGQPHPMDPGPTTPAEGRIALGPYGSAI